MADRPSLLKRLKAKVSRKKRTAKNKKRDAPNKGA